MTTFRRAPVGEPSRAAPAMSGAAARWSAKDNRKLEAPVERHGHRLERRIGLAGARGRAEGGLIGQGVVALYEVGPLLEPRVGDVSPPGLDLRRVALEGEHAPAEVPHPGREPDRRVAPRAADLEHLAVGLRGDKREEELPRRSCDLPSAQLARHPLRPLACVLLLETREDGPYAIVEDAISRSTSGRTKQSARWSLTTPHACIVA